MPSYKELYYYIKFLIFENLNLNIIGFLYELITLHFKCSPKLSQMPDNSGHKDLPTSSIVEWNHCRNTRKETS